MSKAKKVQTVTNLLFEMDDSQLDAMQHFATDLITSAPAVEQWRAARTPKVPETLPLVPEEQHDSNVPTEKILELYHRFCTKLPRVKEFNAARRRAVVARWRENKDRQTLAWWHKYFTFVNEKCPFLTGANQRGWRANFNFLVKKGNMLKIIENEYAKRPTV